MRMLPKNPLTLFLSGDVMLGRGIDQLLGKPSAPELREDYLRDARDYVGLVETLRGAIALPVEASYVWGEALDVLDEVRPAARLINLETAITTSDRFWPGKAIHYRMNPGNIDALEVAKVDACALANNHLLDFDRIGLEDTLRTLGKIGLSWSGAGADLASASAPATLPLPDGGCLRFYSVGHASSGIPGAWAAGPSRSGLVVLPDLSLHTADRLLGRIRVEKSPGALAIVSIHWGANWGYDVPEEQVAFARRLVEGGVDLVHGHSSHHPRGMEVHQGRLILFGCGDFINDYEGIGGYESYRGDLRPMYFPTLAPDGRLLRLRVVLLQSVRLSLRRSSLEDTRWMAGKLSLASKPFGTRAHATGAGDLDVELGSSA